MLVQYKKEMVIVLSTCFIELVKKRVCKWKENGQGGERREKDIRIGRESER